jgi:hypothetical protein
MVITLAFDVNSRSCDMSSSAELSPFFELDEEAEEEEEEEEAACCSL